MFDCLGIMMFDYDTKMHSHRREVKAPMHELPVIQDQLGFKIISFISYNISINSL